MTVTNHITATSKASTNFFITSTTQGTKFSFVKDASKGSHLSMYLMTISFTAEALNAGLQLKLKCPKKAMQKTLKFETYQNQMKVCLGSSMQILKVS